MTEPHVVVTTFRPGPSLVRLVHALAPVFPVVIVDDGSGETADPLLAEAAEAGAEVLRQDRNDGIAAALNRGISAAFEAGAEFVVTFDQDSLPEPETLETLVRSFRALVDDGERVAAVVPREFAAVQQSTASTSEYPDARRVIQSGMVVSRTSFAELGPFDESLFIDLVDTEWELRALRRGFRVVAAPTRIAHELGAMTRLLPFGSRLRLLGVTTMVSTPFRYYYRMRNRLLISRRYLRAQPLRTMRDLVVDLAYFGLIALSARPRRVMIRLLGAGFRDGIRVRGGKMPDALQRSAATVSWSAEAPDDVRP